MVVKKFRMRRILVHEAYPNTNGTCCAVVLVASNFAMLLIKFERRPRICHQLEGTNESMTWENWIEEAFAKGQKYESLREFINSQ
jgi:hypothetical protein